MVRAQHLASFVDEQLDECVDFVVEFTIQPGVDFTPPEFPSAASSEGTDPRQQALAVMRPCAEQFAGRTPLTTCVAHLDREPPGVTATARPEGVAVAVTMTQTNFSFATALADDQRMRECLQMGGDWRAVAEDSREYRHAEINYRAAEAQRELERIRSRRR